MTRCYMFGILMLVACSLLEVSTFPSNNESSTTAAPIEEPIETSNEKDERSLTYDETNIENEDETKDIIKKIAAINEALKKPNRRYPIKWNNPPPPQPDSTYTLDKEILEKLQQVIATGKLHTSHKVKPQENNVINDEQGANLRYARQISPVYAGNQLGMSAAPAAYMMNMPVLIVPGGHNNHAPAGYDMVNYQTRDGPSPFPGFGQFQWPFASMFPILIRDPLLSIMNGGGFQNFIEYGQSADVCKRKQKSDESLKDQQEKQELEEAANFLLSSARKGKSREKRAVKKRTVSQASQAQNTETNTSKKIFSIKPTATAAKPTKPAAMKITTSSDDNEGDLRFPFLFGHKEKPSGPGFFINRLKVRRGGVAIAGPGGVATAGRGGTAIVGPGGLAYTQPGGIAVAGPDARVIALSSQADLTSVANRLQQQSIIDGSVPQLLQAIPEGKIVAIGPIIYFHPNKR